MASTPYDIFSKRHHEMVPTDNELKGALHTSTGEALSASLIDDISINFQFGPSTYDTIQTITGTGSVGQSGAMAAISAGTGIGSAKIVSKDAVRHNPGHETIANFLFRFADPEENINQCIGLRDEENGYSLAYNGLQFGICLRLDSSEIFINQEDFNVNKLDGSGRPSFVLNPQNLAVYRISYGFLGGSPIYISVWGGWENGWILAHVLDKTNQIADQESGSQNLPITAYIERTAGTGEEAACYLSECNAGVVHSAGFDNLKKRRFDYSTIETTIGGGDETSVLLLQNKLLFNGRTNHVKYETIFVEFVTDGVKTVAFRSYNTDNVTLADAVVWVDRDTDNSVMEYSLQNIIVTPLNTFPDRLSTILAKVDSRIENLGGQGFYIYPGESIVITAESSSATDISFTLRSVEYF